MELYIRIVDGKPFEHPILGDNFRSVFPDIDTNIFRWRNRICSNLEKRKTILV